MKCTTLIRKVTYLGPPSILWGRYRCNGSFTIMIVSLSECDYCFFEVSKELLAFFHCLSNQKIMFLRQKTNMNSAFTKITQCHNVGWHRYYDSRLPREAVAMQDFSLSLLLHAACTSHKDFPVVFIKHLTKIFLSEVKLKISTLVIFQIGIVREELF